MFHSAQDLHSASPVSNCLIQSMPFFADIQLWEMACSRHLGLIDLPIVCINVNNYYDPFVDILNRAYKDQLIRLEPHKIVHFAPTSEEAIRWIEEQRHEDEATRDEKLKRSKSVMKRSSFFSALPEPNSGDSSFSLSAVLPGALLFATGLLVGITISHIRR